MGRILIIGILFALHTLLLACTTSLDNDENIAQSESGLFLNGYWTSLTSEEHPPVTCPNGHVTDGMECTGSYCDNVALHCSPISASSRPGDFTYYISEEHPYNAVVCDTDQFMVGVQCNGRYCDNMSIQCASFTGKARDDFNCIWSSWFSDEAQYQYVIDGYAAAGIECRGSYCDSISIFECRVVN